MPDYLPEDGNPNWWEAGPWPPPLHQPFRSVIVPDVLTHAMQIYALSGLTPSSDRGVLLSQMDALRSLARGTLYERALMRLREQG